MAKDRTEKKTKKASKPEKSGDKPSKQPKPSKAKHWMKVWRKGLGLTQKQAALLIGLKPRMIQNYESGTHEVPRYVRLACFALSEKVVDFDAEGPFVTHDLARAADAL